MSLFAWTVSIRHEHAQTYIQQFELQKLQFNISQGRTRSKQNQLNAQAKILRKEFLHDTINKTKQFVYLHAICGVQLFVDFPNRNSM